MSTHQVSYPRAAKNSITEESGRPGTCRSKVGCEAMDDPCTKRIRPAAPDGSPACLFQRKSFTPPSFSVQCSVPLMRSGLFMPSLPLDCVVSDNPRPPVDFRLHEGAKLVGRHHHRRGSLLFPGLLDVRSSDDGVDRLIQERDDLWRCPRRSHDTEPDGHLITPHARLRKGWHVGQYG